MSEKKYQDVYFDPTQSAHTIFDQGFFKKDPAPAFDYQEHVEKLEKVDVDEQRRLDTLIPTRNAYGLIESVVGYDASGQKVRFDFKRDTELSLEKIEIKDV